MKREPKNERGGRGSGRKEGNLPSFLPQPPRSFFLALVSFSSAVKTENLLPPPFLLRNQTETLVTQATLIFANLVLFAA